VIRPYLQHGGIVLCDRYADSTYAHQGYGLGRDLAELQAITAIATGGLLPDITIYLNLSAHEGLERKQRKERAVRGAGPASRTPNNDQQPAPTEWNRLDARGLAYHQRVEQGYQELIAQEPERWHSFDARLPIDALAEQIALAVEPWLKHIQMLEPTPESRQL
jgi:dTMP kinase